MDLISDVIALVVAVATAAVTPQVTPLERQVERTYQVAPGSTVRVELSGGRITVVPSEGRSAGIRLNQRVHTANERDADAALKDYTVILTQSDGDVRLTARRTSGMDVGGWRRIRVNMDAELAVPPDVVLDLHTSGGSIEIRGERTARIGARTSGGSIRLDGGQAPIDVNTSGGSIRVGQAASTLRAHTSGGSIQVERVTDTATDVDVNTSGGSIRVGVSPRARVTLDASTSGGSVSVNGLGIEASRQTRTAVSGSINGGGGRLRAHTSGGSVRIEGAE